MKTEIKNPINIKKVYRLLVLKFVLVVKKMWYCLSSNLDAIAIMYSFVYIIITAKVTEKLTTRNTRLELRTLEQDSAALWL